MTMVISGYLLGSSSLENTFLHVLTFQAGRGPRVVVSTSAFHARVCGLFPDLSGL